MQVPSPSVTQDVASSAPPWRGAPGADARSALEKLPGVVFQLLRSVDGAWTVPFAGQELPRIFMTSAGALAEDAGVAARHVPHDDLDRLKRSLDESRESGRMLKARFRLRPPEHHERWLEVTASPELSFSGGTLWHGFLADVTADQRANRQLRQLHRRWTLAARAAGIGVIEFDRAGAVLSLDAIAAAHHGIDAEQARLDLPRWLDMVVAADRLVAHTALMSVPVEGFAECLVLHLGGAARPGDVRILEFMFQVVQGEDRLVGTCRDVTQQHELDALRGEKLAAEKASRSKSEFMSRVSHELRTPLNGILGFVQLMALDRQHPLPPLHLRRLDVLQQSGSRLLALIDQLLDVSRIEEGRIPLRPKTFEAGPLIDQCVAAVFPQAHARGVQIGVDVAPGAAPLHVDRQAFEQVLSNLLSNAIKYNRPNGRVRVRFETDEFARLSVDDTGIGMSESQLAMLFEPFNRLGAERTGVAGSGLGLVITQKLVHAMGGTLDVQSLAGRGSRFEVRLPASGFDPADSGRSEPSAMPHAAGGGASGRGADRPQVVLYIEDDEVNTLLMEQVFLSHPSWQLVTAATGADGVRAALERQPAAVLLDLHLPDMTGFEVLARLRADPRTRHLPCVAVSADALPGQIEEALARGFVRYWTKPLDLRAVVGELQAVLRNIDASGQT